MRDRLRSVLPNGIKKSRSEEEPLQVSQLHASNVLADGRKGTWIQTVVHAHKKGQCPVSLQV